MQDIESLQKKILKLETSIQKKTKKVAKLKAKLEVFLKAAPEPTPKKKGTLTPEGRAKLAAAMKARWAARKAGASAPNAPVA